MKWSPDLYCLPVERECLKVEGVVHARPVSGNAPFVPDDVLQYECDEGYELTGGQLELLCRMDGKWSGKGPNCTGNVWSVGRSKTTKTVTMRASCPTTIVWCGNTLNNSLICGNVFLKTYAD